MTDRLNGVFVTFERDIRTDDAEGLIAAIRQLRGVLDVAPNVSDYGTHVAQTRARTDLGEKLWAVLYPKHDGEK